MFSIPSNLPEACDSLPTPPFSEPSLPLTGQRRIRLKTAFTPSLTPHPPPTNLVSPFPCTKQRGLHYLPKDFSDCGPVASMTTTWGIW